MLNQAELYHRGNNIQRHDAKIILEEYANLFQRKFDGGDRIMDVGCGSGNVTVDFLEPLLPQNYEKLVCSDSSLKMVNFAAKTYSKNYPKLEFKQLDIEDDYMPNRYLEHFSHITSFYCLQLIQDQR